MALGPIQSAVACSAVSTYILTQLRLTWKDTTNLLYLILCPSLPRIRTPHTVWTVLGPSCSAMYINPPPRVPPSAHQPLYPSRSRFDSFVRHLQLRRLSLHRFTVDLISGSDLSLVPPVPIPRSDNPPPSLMATSTTIHSISYIHNSTVAGPLFLGCRCVRSTIPLRSSSEGTSAVWKVLC